MGQLTMILGLMITATWLLERSGRSGFAGLLLGAMAALKIFPIYLAVYYVAQGRLRPIVFSLLSLLVLTLVTALVLGLESYYDYVGIVLPWNSQFRIFGYNLSIAGFWHKLFHPLNEGEKIVPLWHSLAVAWWGTVVSNLVITTVLITFSYRARTPAQCDLAFASTLTAMLLVSPVTWDTSLLLLLVPMTVIAASRQNRLSRWMQVALMLLLVIVWLPQPLMTILLTGGRTMTVVPPSFLLGVGSVKFYALLGTFAVGLLALHAELIAGRQAMVE